MSLPVKVAQGVAKKVHEMAEDLGFSRMTTDPIPCITYIMPEDEYNPHEIVESMNEIMMPTKPIELTVSLVHVCLPEGKSIDEYSLETSSILKIMTEVWPDVVPMVEGMTEWILNYLDEENISVTEFLIYADKNSTNHLLKLEVKGANIYVYLGEEFYINGLQQPKYLN